MYTLDQAIVNSRKRISDKRRWDFYREMNHGKKILQSQEELEAYMSLYGEMHQFKCKAAIQSFPYENSAMDYIWWTGAAAKASLLYVFSKRLSTADTWIVCRKLR